MASGSGETPCAHPGPTVGNVLWAWLAAVQVTSRGPALSRLGQSNPRRSPTPSVGHCAWLGLSEVMDSQKDKGMGETVVGGSPALKKEEVEGTRIESV